MSLRDIFSDGRDGALARNAIRNAMRTNPQRVPNAPTATLTMQDRGKVGKPNVQLFRNWAEHSEWVRAALNIRRDQVATAEWVIEPRDWDKPADMDMASQITEVLQEPSPIFEEWRPFIQSVVEDLLVLDSGCIEKERTLGGGIAFLHPVDGGTIRVNRFWAGDPDMPRYYWYPDHQERASFLSDDFVYMQANPMTYRVVGLAPLETLRAVIDAELTGQSFNARQVKAPAPDGILDLGEQARPDLVDDFKRYWEAEVAGKGAMAFLGGSKNAKFMPFRANNREMQFLEWQMYLARKIAAVFGMSIQDLGIPLDTNRATAQVTSDQTDDRGLRPLLDLVQSYMTREVVHDPAYGGKANNLAFKFTSLNLRESQSRATVARNSMSGAPWVKLDETRRSEGRAPVGGTLGDSFLAVVGGNIVRFQSEEDIPTARDIIESNSTPPPDDGSSTPKSSEPEVLAR